MSILYLLSNAEHHRSVDNKSEYSESGTAIAEQLAWTDEVARPSGNNRPWLIG